jgi:uncharacterized protein involved in cysteine biosynthesis
VVAYGLLYVLVGWGLSGLQPFHIGWADTVTDLLGGLAIFVITLLLFPSIATLLMSFLLETIATAVETKHFPHLPPPRRQGLVESTWIALRFSVIALLINLLALPVYLLLAFAGIGVGLYYLANGYLLSRDYFELVAARRLDPRAADALRRRHRLRLWLMGILLAFLSTVPVVNLLAPLIATAAMVHEVEKLRDHSAEAV